MDNLTDSNDFPTTAGVYQPNYSNNLDVFVAKLNPTGTSLLYATFLGGSNEDRGQGIAIDSSGNAVITGFTKSTNFPVTTGAQQTVKGSGSNKDGFVTKLNATGTAILYSTYLGGNGNDEAHGIALDSSGNAHLAGYSTSTNFPV
jgi:Beta-propeller repeat